LPGIGSPDRIASLGPTERVRLLRRAAWSDAPQQVAATECVQLPRELDEDDRRPLRACP